MGGKESNTLNMKLPWLTSLSACNTHSINVTIRWIRKAKKTESTLSPAEVKQKKKEKRKREIREIQKKSDIRRKKFILDVIDRNVKVDDEVAEVKLLWDAICSIGCQIGQYSLWNFFITNRKYDKEDVANAQAKAAELGMLYQMLIILHHAGKERAELRSHYVSIFQIFNDNKEKAKYDRKVSRMVYNPVAFAYMNDGFFVQHHCELFQKLQDAKQAMSDNSSFWKDAFLKEMYNHE